MKKEIDIMEWNSDNLCSKTTKPEEYTQMVVWPGTMVEKGDGEKLAMFFKDEFGMEHDVIPMGCITTKPDKKDGKNVEGTGGRIDFLFLVHTRDIGRFAVPRLGYGMRWLEDVVSNRGHKIYPMKFQKELRAWITW
jgi:hypothetical protein